MIAKHIIHALVEMELDNESKYDLLTQIGLTAKSAEIFKACELVRNELVDQEGERKVAEFLGSAQERGDCENGVIEGGGDEMAGGTT